MIYLYRIYQWCIVSPIMLVLSILTAIITIIGCLLFKQDYWGYFPAKWWARMWCWLHLVKVRVQAALFHQLAVTAGLFNAVFSENPNYISALDRSKPVGDREHRAPLCKLFKRLLHNVLTFVIKR